MFPARPGITPGNHSGKADITSVQKACFNFPVFLILSIFTLPYSFHLITASSMGFGIIVHEFLQRGVFSIPTVAHSRVKRLGVPSKRVKGPWPCLLDWTADWCPKWWLVRFLTVISLPSSFFIFSILVWGSLIWGTTKGPFGPFSGLWQTCSKTCLLTASVSALFILNFVKLAKDFHP